jgi:hypothetical protein
VKRIAFDVLDEHMPALRAAVQEINDTVVGRAHGKYAYPTELAITRALIGLAALRVAVIAAMPKDRKGNALDPDPDYPTEQ